MQTSMHFDSGSDRSEDLLPYDGHAVLHTGALASDRAVELFDALTNDLAWANHRVFVFGRWVDQPRLTCWYGDPGFPYRYSGSELQPHPWTPELTELRLLCERLADTRFNSVLANLYRNGSDGVAWHADNEPELGLDPVIASVSLGHERRFDLRHRVTGETVRVPLPAGSVLVMSGATQHHWIHQIAKTAKPIGPRLNLTFRLIHG
jgi:alkylated DNA repair dioxygenase AlkB